MYPLYISGLAAAYLAAYALAITRRTGFGLGMGASVWTLLAFFASPLVLSARSGIAQHGLGEALLDFFLLLLTIAAGLFAFGLQALRLGPAREPLWLNRALAIGGVALCPALGAAIGWLAFQALYR